MADKVRRAPHPRQRQGSISTYRPRRGKVSSGGHVLPALPPIDGERLLISRHIANHRVAGEPGKDSGGRTQRHATQFAMLNLEDKGWRGLPSRIGCRSQAAKFWEFA